MTQIDVIVERDEWNDLADLNQLCLDAARAALAIVSTRQPAEMSIILTGDDESQALNRDWRGKDRPTNVLSFGVDRFDEQKPTGQPTLLGDLVLAYQTCRSEASEEGKTIEDHLRHLIIHGVLHLLGYDHETDADALAMEAKETELLKSLGVDNPYALFT